MAVFTGLYENSAKPIHAIQANEYVDTAVSTDFRCVYDKQFVVGDDSYRIFDPMNIVNVTLDIAGNITSPYGREYIVEITANGFVNIHHRMPIAYGQTYSAEEGVVSIVNGVRLANAYLPNGAMSSEWPIGYGYGLMTNGVNETENVDWIFNDQYDKANFTALGIEMSTTLENYIFEKGYSVLSNITAEFLQKMTTDSYTHRYYALGTTLAISKHHDGNNEDVTCRIRILRKNLPTMSLVLLPVPEEPQ